VAASLPVVEKEKESAHALPPVAEVDTEEEEEKNVVVLSEAPVPWPSQAEAEEELAPSKAGRTSDDASMESAASEWSGRRRSGRWRTCPTRRGG